MNQILQFMLQNKYHLIIIIIAFIIQFKGLAYLIQNKQSDFSYSGHTYEWYEGDTSKTILAILAFLFGIAIITVCILHLYIQIKNN